MYKRSRQGRRSRRPRWKDVIKISPEDLEFLRWIGKEYKRVFRIVIVTDSRGARAEKLLHQVLEEFNIQNIEIIVLVCRGKTLQNIVDYVRNDLKELTPIDLLYFAAGVNDLTKKIGYFNVIPKFKCEEDLIKHLKEYYEKDTAVFKTYAKKVVVCELIGMSMKMYNNNGFRFKEHQKIINQGMVKANREIGKLNRDEGVMTPRIYQLVHKTRKSGKLRNPRYRHALSDGIHFRRDTLHKFIQNLFKTLPSNMKKICF